MKNDSVYQNALRLQLWNKIINIRRENRKLGLFKIDKNMSPIQVMIGIGMVCAIIWIILLLARFLSRVRGYVDDNLMNAILVIANDMLVLALILTVFNIIALYNIMLSLQMEINIEEVAVAGFCLMFFWIITGVYKVIRS